MPTKELVYRWRWGTASAGKPRYGRLPAGLFTCPVCMQPGATVERQSPRSLTMRCSACTLTFTMTRYRLAQAAESLPEGENRERLAAISKGPPETRGRRVD